MALDTVVVILSCLSIAFILYKRSHPSTGSAVRHISRPQGYILENQVTHARLLPAKSRHAFTYPTLSLLLSLNALEDRSLDVGRGWIFGYGNLWGRLVGLRSSPYLADKGRHKTIRAKLEEVLTERGFLDGANMLEDSWMMTMPSLLGFEGINPLTVYFCYKLGVLWLIVLEIHNTFGETHVHVLEVGKDEDKSLPKGYDHQWTFLREFHVSPFNDRSGFYTVSVKNPSHPPTPHSLNICSLPEPPRPAVRIHLHTPFSQSASDPLSPGPLKLTALLRPISAKPLSAPTLLFALSRAPFALFLSLSRILYVAWILHYRKRLDVFLRPEPLPAVSEWGSGMYPTTHQISRIGGGVKWLTEGPLQGYARRRMEAFLMRRVEETGVAVTLVASNPMVPRLVFLPSFSSGTSSHPRLTVSYLSPRFFTILFLSPSAAHAWLHGSTMEGIFFASSIDLFISTFSPSAAFPTSVMTPLQRLRKRPIPASITLPIPPSHAFDEGSILMAILSAIVIWTLLFFGQFEEWLFRVTHARTVKGEEPWKQWERAAESFRQGGVVSTRQHNLIGSVRRD